jgi:hypothetical protein
MRKTVWLLLILLAAAARGERPLTLTDLGRATVPVDGEWQFHPGDDLNWSRPEFDDSSWQSVEVGKDWETQGHPNLTGFAWYRRHVELDGRPDAANLGLTLYLPYVDSAAEVYWNGVKVGSYGRVPPHPVWYGFGQTVPLIADLGVTRSGVLAIRVWKAPYVYYSFPAEGGILEAPRLGSMESLRNLEEARLYRQQQAGEFASTERRISAVLGLFALMLWLRNRRQLVPLWLGIALLFPAAEHAINASAARVSFRLGYSLIGPAVALNEMAIWFLLIALLGLENRKVLVRWTWILAGTALGLDLVDTVCQCFDWTTWPDHLFLHIDVASTLPAVLVSMWGLVLVVAALRKRLDAARWVLAVAALLSDLRQGIEDITGLGIRWTHWNVFQRMSGPLLTLGKSPLNAAALINTLLLLALVYAAWRYSTEQSERQLAMVQELRNAQALQQVLVPESLPALAGYSVSSAYRPAQEVGGDFFQLIALTEDAALLVIGDVSGKGLPAAMAVAMIVGAIHSTAEMTDDPATMLWALNRRLYGRLRGGFATCVAMRLDGNGRCAIANAGHLPPFLNGREFAVLPALPLGLAAEMDYEVTELQLGVGDRLTLYTDGLLEARNSQGELFGFERIGAIAGLTAEAIAQAAQAFGQDDDITVLTLARVGA